MGGEFGLELSSLHYCKSSFVVKELFHYRGGKATEFLIKFLTLQRCSFWNFFNFDFRYYYSTTNMFWFVHSVQSWTTNFIIILKNKLSRKQILLILLLSSCCGVNDYVFGRMEKEP